MPWWCRCRVSCPGLELMGLMVTTELAPGLAGEIVFLYGSLRSGTTLLKVMLREHGEIFNPGEADFLFDFITEDPTLAGGWRYDLVALRNDRVFQSMTLVLPDRLDGLDLLMEMLRQIAAQGSGKQILIINLHRNFGKLRKALPTVRVLHLLRDPRDVARSSIGMGWAGTLYHGVAHWIQTETEWDSGGTGLVAGQVFELRYETFILNVEAELIRLCQFLGLAYDPKVLEFHRSTTYRAPDASLVEQWRRLSHPQEIAQLESRAATLMQSRGYTPTAPARAIGLVEQLRLRVVNRLAVWRFGMKRFGTGLYVGEKLTRWFGFSRWHSSIRIRIRAIASQHIK